MSRDDTDTGNSIFDVELRIETLDTIVDWKRQLQTELRRAQVLEECGQLTDKHLDALARRVYTFLDAAEAHTPKDRL